MSFRRAVGISFLVASVGSAKKALRIIGGDQAEHDRYPYVVSLQDDYGHFCAGSLIGSDVVLTASHCLGVFWPYFAAIGSDKVDEGERIPVRKEIKHPNYFDIGLVFLEHPTELSANISKVKVNEENSYPSTGTIAHVMGWGDTDEDNNVDAQSDILMDVDLEVISNEQCEHAHIFSESTANAKVRSRSSDYEGRIFDHMLCTFTEGKDACQGDSGGPLIIPGDSAESDVQIGIVSWGDNCAYLPGVYTRLSKVFDWMIDLVCNESNDPPDNLCVRPYCVLITTGSNKGDSGRLNVFVDKGNGYSPAAMPGKFHGQYYKESEVVLDQCFATPVTVKVNNPTINNWIGTILFSTDEKVSYSPMECDNCTNRLSLADPIVVHGKTDGRASAANCLDGASCTLSATTSNSTLGLPKQKDSPVEPPTNIPTKHPAPKHKNREPSEITKPTTTSTTKHQASGTATPITQMTSNTTKMSIEKAAAGSQHDKSNEYAPTFEEDNRIEHHESEINSLVIFPTGISGNSEALDSSISPISINVPFYIGAVSLTTMILSWV